MSQLTIDPESLLRQAENLLFSGMREEGLDLLVNIVEQELMAGNYDYVGQVLRAAVSMVDQISMIVHIALLTSTFWRSKQLGVHRDWLFAAVMARLVTERSPEKIRILLNGLEGETNPWVEEG